MMKNKKSGGIALATLLIGVLLAVPASAGGENSQPVVVPPHAVPYGQTYGEWTADWWQWALSLPLERNPIEDPNGSYQAYRQRGHVWFLAGTSGGSVERSVTIPHGKAILFPVLNNVWVTFEEIIDYEGNVWGDDPFSVPGAEASARSQITMNPLADLVVTIDGVDLGTTAYGDGTVENDLHVYRAISPVFPVRMRSSNWFDLWFEGWADSLGGIYPDCVSDGYWFMIDGLSRGEHTLYFKGTDDQGNEDPEDDFVVEVTYHLTMR